jgi:CRISPR-associated protein Csb2
MTWAGTAPTGIVEALDGMARRVPYLGRSTGVALVSASATEDDATPVGPTDELIPYEPCALLDREASVRVPYPGFLAELDAQFVADAPPWEVSRYQGYRRRTAADADSASGVDGRDAVVPSVYTDLVALRLAGLRPQAHLAVRFTAALRSAVLAVAGDRAPQVLHGHGADGRPHVAFLALPDVGGDHSDGHLLGLAVAIPDLPNAERRAVLAAVGGLRRGQVDGVVELGIPGIGTVELLRQPGSVRPWGVSPDRWRRGSRRWASATPVVLDRFPKGPDRLEAEMRANLRRVGLPDPVEIQISPEPLLSGAARLRPSDLPPRAQKRPYRHVAVTFDRRVSGPVLVGAGRYLGIGLLAPLRSDDD